MSDMCNRMTQEMAEIFGITQQPQRAPTAGVAARDAGGGAAPQGRSEPKEGGGFAYQPDEPRPTKQSASLQHPKAGQTGVLSHIDKEGRAAMVDVSRVIGHASFADSNIFLIYSNVCWGTKCESRLYEAIAAKARKSIHQLAI